MSKKLMEILGKYERYLEWKHGTVPCISTADKVELPGIDYFDKNQAHDQIMELLPKKKECKKESDLDCARCKGCNVNAFNQAIAQAQKNMGG